MLGKCENILLGIGAAAVILLGLLITASVVTRSLFGVALPDTIVLVRELMVAAIILPLAATTAARNHVSVSFFTDRLSARIRGWCIIFGSIVGMLALLPLIYSAGREFLHLTSSGSFYFGDLNLPKWPGRAIFVVGIAVCWIRLLTLAVMDIRAGAETTGLAESGH